MGSGRESFAGHLRRRVRRVVSVAVVFGLAVLSGCGERSSTGLQVVDWGVASIEGPRAVKIVGEVDYCVGAPEPRMQDATVTSDAEKIYIKALLSNPADTVQDDKSLCAGVVRAVYKTVMLDRDISESVLFDAGHDPPIERWPRR